MCMKLTPENLNTNSCLYIYGVIITPNYKIMQQISNRIVFIKLNKTKMKYDDTANSRN